MDPDAGAEAEPAPPPQADDPGEERSWPTFYLVGAEKAGTTSLYHYLRQHPEVFLPEEKEPGYFSLYWDLATQPRGWIERTWGDVERGVGDLEAVTEDYLSHYEAAGDEPAVGDCTASYLWHPRAPARIEACTPDARILVLLRDPVERAYSHYLMTWRTGTEDREFLEALEADLERERDGGRPHRYLLSGRYTDLLDRYLDRFGEARVHAAFTERMGQDPRAVLEEMCGFLDVSTSAVEAIETGQRHNPYREPPNRLAHWLRTSEAVTSLARKALPQRVREFVGNHLLLSSGDKPEMSDEARAFLEDHYADEADRLEEITGRRPPWPWA